MKLKDKLKIGTSILIGAGVIYACEKFGLSDSMDNYEIWKASLFGEWAVKGTEYVLPMGRMFRDAGMGFAATALTFAGLNYKKFK